MKSHLKRSGWLLGTLILLASFVGYFWELLAIISEMISGTSFALVYVFGILHYLVFSGLSFLGCMWASRKVSPIRVPIRAAMFLLIAAAFLLPLEMHYRMLKKPWLIREVQRERDFYLRHLLNQGFNPDVRDSRNQTPLMVAAYKGNPSITETLLSYGADVDATGGELNQTALLVACAEGHHEVVEILLSHGADVNIKHIDGLTPLMYSVLQNDAETATILIHYEADVNAKNDDGFTALTYAAVDGHAEMMRLLLNSSANVDKEKSAALVYQVASKEFDSVLKLLRDNGIDLNAKTQNGLTALMIAADKSDIAAARLLLENGAEVNFRDSKGRTPLAYAKKGSDTARLIQESGGVAE